VAAAASILLWAGCGRDTSPQAEDICPVNKEVLAADQSTASQMNDQVLINVENLGKLRVAEKMLPGAQIRVYDRRPERFQKKARPYQQPVIYRDTAENGMIVEDRQGKEYEVTVRRLANQQAEVSICYGGLSASSADLQN
jgi:hypothetical protein